jgi:hypothetical protein
MKTITTKAQIALLLVGCLVAPAVEAANTQPGPKPADNRFATRSEWGARAPKCSIVQMSTLNRAVIHHTASASDFNTTSADTSKSKVRATQNYHMDVNGWCDIGYQYLICKLGFLFEGRSGANTSRPQGAHDGININSFGFTCMGYFHTPYNQQPTYEMRDMLWGAIAWRMPSGWSSYGAGYYNAANTHVGWLTAHRRVNPTACPGDYIWSYIGDDGSGGIARNSINNRRR